LALLLLLTSFVYCYGRSYDSCCFLLVIIKYISYCATIMTTSFVVVGACVYNARDSDDAMNGCCRSVVSSFAARLAVEVQTDDNDDHSPACTSRAVTVITVVL